MKILIINLGSQYTHAIWRTFRDLGVEAVVHPPTFQLKDALFFNTFVFSGGPSSVQTMKKNLATVLLELTKEQKLNRPILGICLGHQLIAHVFGGEVKKGQTAEYGLVEIEVLKSHPVFEEVPKKFTAWASHFDQVYSLPQEFSVLAKSQNCQIEAFAHNLKPIVGVQFHPEVLHTQYGSKILSNFANYASKFID
ncbi:MAG: GMP synthase subunit A [Candidatus Micrarchaeota archaeon]|nr:GMP synthase subunit A [Candidatus Micrarchaeota archaeon]